MKRISLIVLFAFGSGALLLGDTITLKDGTKLEGKITEEDAQTVTIKVEGANGGVAVPKIIIKADIAKMEKDGPDQAVFEALRGLVPAPDRLTATQYKERIGRGQAFLNRFPGSRHAPAVKKMMEKLEAEHKLAANGGIKLEGLWISAADRAANAYEIDARLEISDMETDFKNGRHQLALRHFEKIQADFIASEKYGTARALAIQTLTAYQPLVAGDLARIDSRLKKRTEGISRLPASQRKAEEGAIEARDAAYLKRVQAEKAAKTKWLTLNSYHRQPLQDVSRNIDATLKSLQSKSTSEGKVAGPIYRAAWSDALAGNYEEGKKLLTELKSLKVPTRYLAALEKKLTPPKPDPEDPDPEDPDPADTPPPPKKSDPPEGTPTPGDKDKEATAKDKDAKPDSPSPPPPLDSAKKRFPIQIVLVIVLALVIVGALLAAFAGKKK